MEGCCNDARLVRDMLYRKGFQDDDIRLLTDDDDSYPRPDHVNVKRALNWLCKGREEGDIVFLHFSGHGTQVGSNPHLFSHIFHPSIRACIHLHFAASHFTHPSLTHYLKF